MATGGLSRVTWPRSHSEVIVSRVRLTSKTHLAVLQLASASPMNVLLGACQEACVTLR